MSKAAVDVDGRRSPLVLLLEGQREETVHRFGQAVGGEFGYAVTGDLHEADVPRGVVDLSRDSFARATVP